MITIQLVQYEPISLRYHQLENTPLRNSMARKLPLIFFFFHFLSKNFVTILFSTAKKKKKTRVDYFTLDLSSIIYVATKMLSWTIQILRMNIVECSSVA